MNVYKNLSPKTFILCLTVERSLFPESRSWNSYKFTWSFILYETQSTIPIVSVEENLKSPSSVYVSYHIELYQLNDSISDGSESS